MVAESMAEIADCELWSKRRARLPRAGDLKSHRHDNPQSAIPCPASTAARLINFARFPSPRIRPALHGLGARRHGRYARHLQRDDRGECARLDEGAEGARRLADGGVFDAALLDAAAEAARQLQGPARRAQRGDPAADRPLAARGDRSRSARAAHAVHRLRRAPGRWRHAHGVDHRRLRGRRAGGAKADRGRAARRNRRSRRWSPRSASAWSAASRCSI